MRGVSFLAGSANISLGSPSCRILIRRGSVTSRTLSSTASSSCSRGCWKRRLSAQRWRRSARRFSASARLMSASRSLAKASRGAAIFSSSVRRIYRLQRRLCGPRCRDIIGGLLFRGGLLFGADIIGGRSSIGGRRGRLRLRLWLRCGCARRGRGVRRNHTRHRLRRCRRDVYRFRRHPAFQLGDRLRGRACNVRSQIATAKTSADRHDHGSHACKISRRYPHVSAPSIHAGNAWHGPMFRHVMVRKLEPAALQSQGSPLRSSRRLFPGR